MKKIIKMAVIIGTAVCAMTGCSNNQNQQDAQPKPNTQESNNSMNEDTADKEKTTDNAQSGNEPDSSTDNNRADGNIISEEQAKQIALADAQVTEADISGITVKMETDDSVQQYEVKFYTADQEFDYDIDAKNGTIRKKDSDINDHTARTGDTDHTGEIISQQEAKALALAKVPEAAETALQMHQETDDGRQVYKGAIVYNDTKYEFEMDAATGTFIEWEEESVFD